MTLLSVCSTHRRNGTQWHRKRRTSSIRCWRWTRQNGSPLRKRWSTHGSAYVDQHLTSQGVDGPRCRDPLTGSIFPAADYLVRFQVCPNIVTFVRFRSYLRVCCSWPLLVNLYLAEFLGSNPWPHSMKSMDNNSTFMAKFYVSPILPCDITSSTLISSDGCVISMVLVPRISNSALKLKKVAMLLGNSVTITWLLSSTSLPMLDNGQWNKNKGF